MENTQQSEISLGDFLGLNGGDFILEDNPIAPVQAPFVLGEPGEQEEAPEEETTEETEEITPPAPAAPAKEDEKPEEGKPAGEVSTSYLGISKKLLSTGKWHDALIEIDGKEVKLSEIDNLDEETFLQIDEAQRTMTQEDIEANYISVKDIDEDKKKLINIITNGGDLKKIFQSEERLKRPFEGVDLTKESNQMGLVYNQYIKQGLDPGEAKRLTEDAQKNLTLDSKVEQIVKAYNDHYDKTLAEVEKQTIAAKQAEEAAIKDYRKNLSTLYKEEKLPDNIAKRLIDAATKKDETGNLAIDSMYEKLMQDPKEAKELIFFMLEREKYLQAKGANIKTGVQMDMIRTVKILRDTGAKSTTKQDTPEEVVKNPFGQEIILEG